MKINISASEVKLGHGSVLSPNVRPASVRNFRPSRGRRKAWIAISTSAGALRYFGSMIGGIDMSALWIETVPRKRGATRELVIVAEFPSCGSDVNLFNE